MALCTVETPPPELGSPYSTAFLPVAEDIHLNEHEMGNPAAASGVLT